MCGIVCLTKGESVCGGFRYVEADQDCFTGKAKTGDATDDKQFVYKLVHIPRIFGCWCFDIFDSITTNNTFNEVGI